jgi:carboxyl-terminal processing protease
MAKKWMILALLIGAVLLQPLWMKDEWQRSLEKIASMFSLIQDHYYKDVDIKELTYASISGMLPTLDPHSYFLDPTNLATMTEDYRGKYYGLGILIQKHWDLLKVISPIEGGPAYRLGVLPNDVISHINGESTKPITSYQAMQKLRGEKGTEVNITIMREGLDEPMELTIKREEIPLESIRYAFILKDDIGYIYIRNFAETTGREFREKMEQLKELGMKKLILDFRYNGGGTFLQSLELSEDLLPKDSVIVSIKGRNQYYNRLFKAQKDGRFTDVPLVVIIHQGTASAPEIVSGAVKDNDRGLIVGEPSWGKGLVQTVFSLRGEKNAAVALTTAKYYTPSGRSIQRDFSSIEDYLGYQEVPEDAREVAYTTGGRKVLGQGGINPDFEVGFAFKPLTYSLLLRGSFFAYARRFFEKKTPLSQKVVTGGSLPAGFAIDLALLQDFQSFLEDIEIEYESEQFQEARDQLVRELEKEITASFFGLQEGERVYRLSDPLVQKAIEVLPEAEKLLHQR